MNSDHQKRAQPKNPLHWIRLILPLLFLTLPAMGGLLTLIDVLRDGVGLTEGLGGATAITISSDGGHVYSAGRDDHAMTVFFRDVEFGTLSFYEAYESESGGIFGLLGASSVATSPDGRHVYATGQFDDTLVVFANDASMDTFTFVAGAAQENNVGGVIGLDGASSVAISGDDEQVFVTANIDDALAVFSRDASTDALTFVEAELNGFDGVTGLDGASAVAVSPDHKHVYVAGEFDDALVLFTRQPGGTIDFVASYQNGSGAIEGINGACAVVVSPDGNHLYAVGNIDDAVATFARDSSTGALTFLAVERDGVGGVDGLAGAAGIAISPTGDRVFVAGEDDNSITVFRRTAATGALDFLEVLKDGIDGIDGLGGVVALVVSPNGKHLYSASRNDNAVDRFSIASCLGNPATGDSDGDAFCDDIDFCLGDDLLDDTDADQVCDDLDICPGFDDFLDGDSDGVPDGCDLCQGDDATGDSDTDGVCDDLDVCADSPDNVDDDFDGIPDGCDFCFGNNITGDSDSDGVCDDLDLCLGDDATGDTDADGTCDEIDCDPFDDQATVIDSCGICGGDSTTCLLFIDGFEAGDLAAWSTSVP
jgi:6-phosphogluconolactonase (cycloisomerase 2 family)